MPYLQGPEQRFCIFVFLWCGWSRDGGKITPLLMSRFGLMIPGSHALLEVRGLGKRQGDEFRTSEGCLFNSARSPSKFVVAVLLLLDYRNIPIRPVSHG